MKAQMVGEDFIIGFIFFFLLATTVFLFVNSGGGSNIDFFNTSIYQEERFLMDYIYIRGYDLDTGAFDPLAITFSPANFDKLVVTSEIPNQDLNISFNISRTGFPAGDYDESIMNFPINYIVYYPNYSLTEGAFNARVYNTYDKTYKYDNFNVTLQVFNATTLYPKCKSNITIKIELLSEEYEETWLSNNEYNIPVNFCVFKKTDLNVSSTAFNSDSEIFSVTVGNVYEDVEFSLLIDSLLYGDMEFSSLVDPLYSLNNTWERINMTNFQFYNATGGPYFQNNPNFLVNEDSWIKVEFNLDNFYLGENVVETKIVKCANFKRFNITIQSSIIEYDLNNNKFEQIITGCP